MTQEEKAVIHPLPESPLVPKSSDLSIERSVIIDASAEKIYQDFIKAELWPEWDPNVSVTQVYAERPLQEGDRFDWDPGGFQVSTVVLEAVEGKYIRWRGETPDGAIGVRSYHFIPQGDGKTLVICQEGFSSWYFFMFSWATHFGIGDQIQSTLVSLKGYVETGQ